MKKQLIIFGGLFLLAGVYAFTAHKTYKTGDVLLLQKQRFAACYAGLPNDACIQFYSHDLPHICESFRHGSDWSVEYPKEEVKEHYARLQVALKKHRFHEQLPSLRDLGCEML